MPKPGAMVAPPDNPPFRPGAEALAAGYTLDRAALIGAHLEIHDRSIRRSQVLSLTASAVLALLILSDRQTGLAVLLLMVAMTTWGIGARRLTAKGVGDLLDRASGGSGQLRFELAVSAETLQIGGDVDRETMAWRDLTCRRGTRHLTLTTAGRRTLVLPLDALPPGFSELAEQRVRAAGGIERQPERPLPLVARAAQVVLTVPVTVLVAWAAVISINSGTFHWF